MEDEVHSREYFSRDEQSLQQLSVRSRSKLASRPVARVAIQAVAAKVGCFSDRKIVIDSNRTEAPAPDPEWLDLAQ
jgi:hypothetical protein